jgi:hypothetical protein
MSTTTGTTVTIYGASDDLIEVEGVIPGCDEYSEESARFIVIGEAGSTRVAVRYDENGVWAVTLSPLDEDTPMLAAVVGSDRYTARAAFSGASRVIREHE